MEKNFKKLATNYHILVIKIVWFIQHHSAGAPA